MQVEIWSDVVCPWCAVGKVRFEQALEAFDGDVDVRWRSFELDPNRTTVPDQDYVTLLATKYRTTPEQAQGMIDQMTAAGAADGIEFRFDLARPGNTFDAHRIIHLGHDRGVQHAVKDRFLAGYHSEGVPIADHGALVELATDAGLDADEVREVLATDAYAADVRADEQQAHDYGISGVPFFVLDGRVGVSGAQPSSHLLAALQQASDDTPVDASHAHDHPEGAACDDGSCAV